MSQTVSVIVPVHNEADSLAAAVRDILSFVPPNFMTEIVLVNDASTDASNEVMRQLQREHLGLIKIVNHSNQRGLGAALSTGFKAASGDILTWIPGDGEFSFSDVANGITNLDGADIVLVSRTSRGQIHRGVISAIMHLMIQVLFKADLRNFCGIFVISESKWKVVSTESTSAIFAFEVAISSVKHGYRIAWVTANWSPRVAGTSSVFRPRVLFSSFWDLLRLIGKMKRISSPKG